MDQRKQEGMKRKKESFCVLEKGVFVGGTLKGRKFMFGPNQTF
jgi:hypothetical protein